MRRQVQFLQYTLQELTAKHKRGSQAIDNCCTDEDRECTACVDVQKKLTELEKERKSQTMKVGELEELVKTQDKKIKGVDTHVRIVIALTRDIHSLRKVAASKRKCNKLEKQVSTQRAVINEHRMASEQLACIQREHAKLQSVDHMKEQLSRAEAEKYDRDVTIRGIWQTLDVFWHDQFDACWLFLYFRIGERSTQLRVEIVGCKGCA